MPTRMPKSFLLILVACTLGLVACSDDDPVAPDESFAITVTVLDALGQPVADQPVLVLPVLPPGVLQDGLQAAAMPAAVHLRFEVPSSCLVDVEISDVAGATVRRLITDYEAPPGTHVVLWNGLDNDDVHQSTGWYGATLTCRDAANGELLYTDTRGLLMVLVDFDRTPYRTDAQGQLTITDRRVVPGFWDLEELHFTDENGDLTGVYTLTRATQIRAGGARVEFEADDGPQNVTVQLGPAPASAPAITELAMPVGALIPPPLPDGGYEFRDPYPNPFN